MYEQTSRRGKNSFVPGTAIAKWRLQRGVKRSFVRSGNIVFSRVSNGISVGVQFRGKDPRIRRVRALVQRLLL